MEPADARKNECEIPFVRFKQIRLLSAPHFELVGTVLDSPAGYISNHLH